MRFPNGYGSITKLSGKRRNPYMVRITIGLDEDTLKPVRKVLGYYPKRADAIAALAKYNEDPYDLSQHAYTFAEVYQMWSAQYFPGVAASTKGTHAAAFKAWAPLHDMAMKDIKLLHYQKALNESEKSPNVKQRMKNLASILSEYAIRHEIIEKDYSRYIEPGGQAEVKRPHQPFTGEEIQTLWDNVGTVAYVDAALILIYTGMRVGELLAMRKENVHLDEKYMIGGSKTAAGKNRIIPLNENPAADPHPVSDGKRLPDRACRILQHFFQTVSPHDEAPGDGPPKPRRPPHLCQPDGYRWRQRKSHQNNHGPFRRRSHQQGLHS